MSHFRIRHRDGGISDFGMSPVSGNIAGGRPAFAQDELGPAVGQWWHESHWGNSRWQSGARPRSRPPWLPVLSGIPRQAWRDAFGNQPLRAGFDSPDHLCSGHCATDRLRQQGQREPVVIHYPNRQHAFIMGQPRGLPSAETNWTPGMPAKMEPSTTSLDGRMPEPK